MKRVVVVRCPKCGSTDAGSDESRSVADISYMVCGACGFEQPQDTYELGDNWNVEMMLPDDVKEIPVSVPPRTRFGARVLVREGPFEWYDEGAPHIVERRAFFHVPGGGWEDAIGVDAFRVLVQRHIPGLEVGQQQVHLIRAFTRLTATEALLAQADVDDLCDPRWHVIPLSREAAAQWEPPHVEGQRLTFVVHDKGTLQAVLVDGETGDVEVTRRA